MVIQWGMVVAFVIASLLVVVLSKFVLPKLGINAFEYQFERTV